MEKLVDYVKLTPAEREAVHQWLRDHDCVPELTPLDGILGVDPETGEMMIEQYLTRDGQKYIGDDGEFAKVVVRRQIARELPWRTE